MRKEEQITFLNRKECCEIFNIQDSDDNIKVIEQVISEAPKYSLMRFLFPVGSVKEDLPMIGAC